VTLFWRVLLLAALLFGFAIRAYELEGQSMWSDEGLSLYRARQPLAQIHQNIITVDGIDTQDTTPPFYFYLLHAWRAVTGERVFTLRFVGVLLGVLAIPFAYLCGKLLTADHRAGVMAAVFLAISPLHVWESQELRNYSLLVLLNFVSVYGLWRFVLRGQHGRWLALWMAGSLIGIYSHYFSFFVFAYGLLVLAIWAMGRYRQQLWQQKWAWLGGITCLLLILPILPIATSRFLAGQQVDFFHISLPEVLNQVVSAYGVGVSPTLTHPWLWWLPAAALALVGLILLWPRRPSRWLLLGYQFIPFALLLLLSLFNPLYNGVRHTILGLPPFILFMGCGAVLLPKGIKGGTAVLLRSLQFILVLLVLGIQLNWLQAQFTAPELVRDDVRGAAEYLNQFATADDLIILHDTLISFTFDYYYHGAAPTRTIPLYGQFDVAAAEAELAEAGTQAQRIWFLTRPTPRNGFPRETLIQWANTHWPRFFSKDFPSMWLRVKLIGYTPDPAQATLPTQATPIQAVFGDKLQLHGVEMPQTLSAGQPWWLVSYWSHAPSSAEDYGISVRLVDEQGKLWQQADHPLWQDYSPTDWQPQQMIRYDQEIQIPAGLPPGRYQVWLRVVADDTGPLTTADGAVDLLLGEVATTASHNPKQLPAYTAQSARLGAVELLGYHLPGNQVRPGHILPLDLFWQVKRNPIENWRLQVQVLDTAGQVMGQMITSPTPESYPSSQWQADELLQSKVEVPMPGHLVDGEAYTLEVSLIKADSGQRVGRAVVLDTPITAIGWPKETELPPIPNPLRANFGQPPAIELHGYDLSTNTLQPGATVDLTLFWRAIEPVTAHYKVFVHLLAADNSFITQADGIPVSGMRPTTSWRSGEVFVDPYPFTLPPDVAPGSYDLWVGFYEAESGQRPFTSINSTPQPDGRVLLTNLIVEPLP
jgi:4-amino-4-deoxy-L-arabinose transferase-like glycosyltransferase